MIPAGGIGGAAMTTSDEAFVAKYPGAAVFRQHSKAGTVLLAANDQRMVLVAKGPVGSDHLTEVLRQMRAAGYPKNDAFSALIDLTEFTGTIDWDEIKKVREIMPAGASRTNRNAYVVHDNFLAMIAKITAAMFPQTTCAAFTTEAEARAWLGWDQR